MFNQHLQKLLKNYITKLGDLSKIRVAVLLGGIGPEREISLLSGECVAKAMQTAGFSTQVCVVHGQADEIARLNCDVVFPALHGEYGEDGRVQTQLEQLKIPYIGSCPAACQLIMDKNLTKNKLVEANLPTAQWQLLQTKTEFSQEQLLLDLPVVVKPTSCGSSVGVTIVRQFTELLPAISTAFKYHSEVMIEKFIPGRELTVGYLARTALPVIELKTTREFFDYQAKYFDPTTEHICPAELTPDQTKELQDLALKTATEVGLRHFGRIDYILAATGPIILEVNAIPGFCATSLLPQAANEAGLPLPDVCKLLVGLALELN